MTAGRLTQITGRGYTDSAPEKDGVGCGNPMIEGARRRNPVLCGFFVRNVSPMAGLYGPSSDGPFPSTRFSTPYSLATQPWKVGLQVTRTCRRRDTMSHSIATPVAPTVPQLRDAIELMDSLSESGFSEIASIAKMALAYLETPNVALHVEDIANALSAIQGKAEDIKNCINYQAEEVGCNYVDEAKIRRLNVWFKGA